MARAREHPCVCVLRRAIRSVPICADWLNGNQDARFYSCRDGTARALAAIVGPTHPDVARRNGDHDGRSDLGSAYAAAERLKAVGASDAGAA